MSEYFRRNLMIFIIQGFKIIISSLLLYSQCFTQNVFQPSSDVCQTWNPIQNFKTCPFFNPRGGTLVLIPLTITK